jgi:hypothetical protein
VDYATVAAGAVKGIQNGLKVIQIILNDFKTIQTSFNSKRTFPILKKIEIKQGCEGLE